MAPSIELQSVESCALNGFNGWVLNPKVNIRAANVTHARVTRPFHNLIGPRCARPFSYRANVAVVTRDGYIEGPTALVEPSPGALR